MFKSMVAAIGLSTVSIISQAAWLVDNANSDLNFVSIKKSHVAETHHFSRLSGELKDNGQFELAIALTSVETGVDIRNQRMQQYLFMTDKFTSAQLTAQLDPTLVSKLAVAGTARHIIKGQLSLHGVTKAINFDVRVTKVSTDVLLVSSIKPVIINAADFVLAGGIDKLLELAKLPQISYAVPVWFNLRLVHEPASD